MKSNSGQIVIEYVLLLVISVTVAIGATSALVKRSSTASQTNPEGGMLIKNWIKILDKIATDQIEE